MSELTIEQLDENGIKREPEYWNFVRWGHAKRSLLARDANGAVHEIHVELALPYGYEYIQEHVLTDAPTWIWPVCLLKPTGPDDIAPSGSSSDRPCDTTEEGEMPRITRIDCSPFAPLEAISHELVFDGLGFLRLAAGVRYCMRIRGGATVWLRNCGEFMLDGEPRLPAGPDKGSTEASRSDDGKTWEEESRDEVARLMQREGYDGWQTVWCRTHGNGYARNGGAAWLEKNGWTLGEMQPLRKEYWTWLHGGDYPTVRRVDYRRKGTESDCDNTATVQDFADLQRILSSGLIVAGKGVDCLDEDEILLFNLLVTPERTRPGWMLSYKKIGKRLNCSHTEVGRRVKKLREKLREKKPPIARFLAGARHKHKGNAQDPDQCDSGHQTPDRRPRSEEC